MPKSNRHQLRLKQQQQQKQLQTARPRLLNCRNVRRIVLILIGFALLGLRQETAENSSRLGSLLQSLTTATTSQAGGTSWNTTTPTRTLNIEGAASSSIRSQGSYPTTKTTTKAGPPADKTTTTTTTFAVVIVHCKEDAAKTSWYNQIPADWRITVYETCGEKATISPYHQHKSYKNVQFQNAGSEECTAYLDYVLQNRNHLADITLFLQTDTLRGYTNANKMDPRLVSFNLTAHSPFTHFDQLAQATREAMVPPHGRQKFLHYGWPILNFNTFGANVSDAAYEPYVGDYLKEMWKIFAKATDTKGNYVNRHHSFVGKTVTRPGAIFAVHKSRILANPPAVYKQLSDKIMTPPLILSASSPARRRCCSLENTWHVLFGEPAALPNASTVDQYYKGAHLWGY